MKQINLKEMYDAGVHLGSSVKSLNPKMKPYIMCTHEGIAIIDILKTYTHLFRITLFLKKIIATEGYRILFVGTQKAIAPVIAEIATKSSSYYINDRWKGGFLTNFKTIREQNSLGSDRKSGPLSNSTQDSNLSTNFRAKPGAEPQEKKAFSNVLPDKQRRVFADEKNTMVAGGIHDSTKLTELPDLVIVVGQEKELKAIKECQKLNIPTICICDSDGDPEKTSLFIPANDDSRASVEFILKHLGQSILVGRLLYDKKKKEAWPALRGKNS